MVNDTTPWDAIFLVMDVLISTQNIVPPFCDNLIIVYENKSKLYKKSEIVWSWKCKDFVKYLQNVYI